MRFASTSACLHNVRGRLSGRAEDDEIGLGRWLVLSLMIGIVAGLGAVLLQWGIDSVNRGGLLTGLIGLGAPQAISLGYGWVQTGMLDQLTLVDYFKGALGKILATACTISSGGLLVPLMLSTAVAVVLVPKRVSIYEEQVDGSVNSPAHFDRYLRHVQKALHAGDR